MSEAIRSLDRLIVLTIATAALQAVILASTIGLSARLHAINRSRAFSTVSSPDLGKAMTDEMPIEIALNLGVLLVPIGLGIALWLLLRRGWPGVPVWLLLCGGGHHHHPHDCDW